VFHALKRRATQEASSDRRREGRAESFRCTR
jgi:hypothetical protein